MPTTPTTPPKTEKPPKPADPLHPFRDWMLARNLSAPAVATYTSLVRRLFREAGQIDPDGARVLTAEGLRAWFLAFPGLRGPYASAWAQYRAWGDAQGWAALPAFPGARPTGEPPPAALSALAALGRVLPLLAAGSWPDPISPVAWALTPSELAALETLRAEWSAPRGWAEGQPLLPGAPGGVRAAGAQAARRWSKLGALSPLERGLRQITQARRAGVIE